MKHKKKTYRHITKKKLTKIWHRILYDLCREQIECLRLKNGKWEIQIEWEIHSKWIMNLRKRSPENSNTQIYDESPSSSKKKKQNVDILLRNLFYGILLVILSGLKQNYYENSHGNEDYWNHPHKFSQYMKKHFENAEFSKTLKKT